MSRSHDVNGNLADTAPEASFGLGGDEEEPKLFDDPKVIVQTVVAVLALVAAIYFLFPKLVGVEDGLRRLGSGSAVWIVVALACGFAMFAAYVALFKGIVGGNALALTWGESYKINMAGLAATRLFSAGGAGGIVLTYWALRKAGMPRRQSAARMVAFLVLLYAIYMFTVIVNGVLLRTGVLSGQNPAGLTIVPAAIAGGVVILFLLVAMIPADLQRRLASSSSDTRRGRLAVRLATVPATVSTGVRSAIEIVRSPRVGWLALAGAVGFWAANIAILWASFKAFHVDIAGAVVVQGFFIGMVANLIPGAPGGVGAVDAGMIGAFVLFGVAGDAVFASVLCYRLVAFWLPIPPGIIAFFQLRRAVAGWDAGDRPIDRTEGSGANRFETLLHGDEEREAAAPRK